MRRSGPAGLAAPEPSYALCLCLGVPEKNVGEAIVTVVMVAAEIGDAFPDGYPAMNGGGHGVPRS
jgi:hypothetical protein